MAPLPSPLPKSSSSTSHIPVPSTLLPSSSSAQKQYLHSTQQAHLRRLYSHKVLHLAQQQELDQLRLARRARSTRGTRRGGRGRATESDDDSWDSDAQLATSNAVTTGGGRGGGGGGGGEEFGEAYVKRRKLDQPAPPPPASSSLSPSSDSELIDSAHVYQLMYDLSPSGSSDAFYHGPHPPPPASIVRSILTASRTPPFFDPTGLAVPQLEAITRDLWSSEGGGQAFLEAKEGEVVEREAVEREDEWEQELVAQFSTGIINCHCQ
ncbi:hypothetical protein RQP46_001698 [Phenoliferia psychrophenolica]